MNHEPPTTPARAADTVPAMVGRASRSVCLTHHYACNCREKLTRELIEDLFDLAREWKQGASCAWVDPLARYSELKAKAETLGYYPANAEAQRSPASGDKLPPLVGSLNQEDKG